MVRKVASIFTTETTSSDPCTRPNYIDFSISKPVTIEKAMHTTIPATTPFEENPHFGENYEVIFGIYPEGDEQLDDDFMKDVTSKADGDGNTKAENKAKPDNDEANEVEKETTTDEATEVHLAVVG
eukprot:12523674-Ditylum_brightwellii.AAC.1